MSTKEPKHDIKRGRHKKRASRETREWEEQHLPPECPPWMSPETYARLRELRDEAERAVL